MKFIAYCRPGFENDAINELNQLSTAKQCFGYATAKPNSALVTFTAYQAEDAAKFVATQAVAETIFPRQLVAVIDDITLDDRNDRLSPVLGAIQTFVGEHSDFAEQRFGDVWCEYPDTEEGKTLAKFCRKFTVVARRGLRDAGLLSKKEDLKRPIIHLLFTDFDQVVVGYSLPQTRAPFLNGICRLKFPPTAPSRSTLKLEEAINVMLNDEQRARVFRTGSTAVDLGACPGGWTYQLVERGMHVEAVDNGKMAESLMATGQVAYRPEDGFRYKPDAGRVALLVCDMIEQPDRVNRLMCEWLVQGMAEHAIYNLKLPMKKRFETVSQARDHLMQQLGRCKTSFAVAIRHLYHNRDEVTVSVIRND